MKCSPTQKVYGQCPVVKTIQTVGAPAPVHTAGTLPFTGMDLGLVGGAGVVLVAMGISLRRVTRNHR